MSTQIVDKLYTKFHENKLAHVYLIETNEIEKTLRELLELIKRINCSHTFTENCQKCNFCNLIDKNYFPNLITIFPEGQFIKKEQVDYLQEKFSLKPVLGKNNIYIILEAEKLNPSSGNSLLKFLEEPNENIFGFLVTKNTSKILQTIISRCQKLKNFYNENDTLDNSLEQKFINCFENRDESIILDKKIYDKLLDDKQTLSLFFNQLLKYYLSKTVKITYNDQKKVKIIKKYIEKINYNVNIELLLEAFVLEMSDNCEIL